METKIYLKAVKREKMGKGPSRQLRQKGFIPAVLYGGGDSMPLTIDPVELSKLLKELGSERAIIPLSVEGESGAEKNVILKDAQVDPISDELLHVDLLEVFMDRKITVEVPIALRGEPERIRGGEAIIEQLLNSLEVECLPGIIPREIVADVTGLSIGAGLHVKDLQLPEGVKALREGDVPVVIISTAKAEVARAVEAEEGAEEGAEKAEAAEEE